MDKYVDEHKDEHLITEIEEVLDRASVENLKQTQSKKSPHVEVFQVYLFTGLFFFLTFLFTITAESLLIKGLSAISFILFTLCFSITIANIFTQKKRDTLMSIVAIGLLLILGISYFALYEFVLQSINIIITIALAVLLFFTTAFYLLHVYLGYLRNRKAYESMVSGTILVACWLLLLVQALYQTSLTFFLLIVGVLVTLKVVGDFSATFKDKK